MDNSSILQQRFNTSITTDSGKMKDCQADLQKLILKTLENSHRCIRKAVQILNDPVENEKNKGRDIDNMEECTLTQLLKQNFMTDYKIYILGNIDLSQMQEPRIGVEAIVKTLDFVSDFKSNVGSFLMKNNEKEKSNASIDSGPPGSILKDLIETEEIAVTPSHIAISKRDAWLMKKNLKLKMFPEKPTNPPTPRIEDEVLPFDAKSLILDGDMPKIVDLEVTPEDFGGLATVMTKFFTFMGGVGGEELEENEREEVEVRMRQGLSVSRISKVNNEEKSYVYRGHHSYLGDMPSGDEVLLTAIRNKANEFQQNLILLDVSEHEVEDGIRNNSKYINPSILNTSRSLAQKLFSGTQDGKDVQQIVPSVKEIQKVESGPHSRYSAPNNFRKPTPGIYIYIYI